MRIVFLGSPPFALPAFEHVVGRSESPVGLATAPPRRAGRGRKETENPLVTLASREGIPVLRPPRASDPDFLAALRALRPELGVVVSYGQILREELLALPRLGCINVHASLLPRWRGASPIQAALLAGDAETGVCVQKVVRALDAGPVLAARATVIGEREDAVSLQARLARLGAEVLAEFLDSVGDGPLPEGRAQDESRVTVCRKVRREEARIDWSAASEQVDRVVRAYAGWPVAETTLPGGATVRVLHGEPRGASGAAAPGTVRAAGEELLVACGAGTFAIAELQRPGKAPLRAAEFLRGARLALGDRLGAAS